MSRSSSIQRSPVSPLDGSHVPFLDTTTNRSVAQNNPAISDSVASASTQTSTDSVSQDDGTSASSPTSTMLKPLRKRKRYAQLAIDLWIFEICSLWTSCVCLGGIFIVLGLHDNKPLPTWPLDITINALVSVLAVVMKSSLLVPVASTISQSAWHWFNRDPHPLLDIEVYDEASRGPWGSAMLLLSIRWRNIASLGAFITILAMAMDPFVQQVTSYEPGSVNTGSLSTIPSRRVFDAGLDNSLAHANVPPPIRAAIYQGIFFTPERNDTFAMSALAPRPNCGTGNCTYPEFETLAVCNKCANITDRLRREWKAPSPTQEAAYSWSLPNGFSSGDISTTNRNPVIMTASAGYEAVMLEAGLPLLNYTAIFIPDPLLPNGDEPEGNNVTIAATAEECMLYWCVRKYKSSITNGLLSETVLETTDNGEDDIGLLYRFQPVGSNSSLEIGNLSFRNHNPTWGEYPEGTFTGTFFVNKNASKLITDFFNSTIGGDVTANDDPTYGDRSTAPIPQRFQIATLPTVFETLSESMTTSIRGAGSRTLYTDQGLVDNTTIIGYSTIAVTYIRVRWWWLTLPVALEVATIILLLYTMFKSRKMKVWKSSALALMFHGMNAEQLTSTEKVERYIDMEGVAKEKKVQLSNKGGGRQRLEIENGVKP